MISTLDTGQRCDGHVGEVFPPRCYDCGTTSPDAAPAPRAPTVNGRCARHPDYPATDRFECARCVRDREISIVNSSKEHVDARESTA